MKVIHLIGGGDIGGAKSHVLSLVKELGKHTDVKIISFRSGVFFDEAKDMGIDIEVVRTGNILRDLWKVVRIIKKGKFQIVHSHGAKANMISVLSKPFLGLPTVTTVHSDYKLDYLHSKFKQLTFGTINTLCLRFIDDYVAVSKNFMEMLIERKFNADNIYKVYNGIDLSINIANYNRKDFYQKYNLNLNETDFLVGTPVRLHPVKGAHIFIDAALEVLKKYPEIRFIIGGDGGERKALEAKVQEYGITNEVLFAGWITDINEFMSCIDINVLASLSDSFPYQLLEGARLGKPTISSDVGGISDLIESGVTGYLFPAGDFRALSECIMKMYTDKENMGVMGQNLLKKTIENFSIEAMCNTQIKIYSSILNR